MKHIKLFEGFLNEIDLDDLERRVNRLRNQTYRPSDYNDIVIWNAIRDRKAPTVIGGNYAVPTDYHAKMRYFKMFESTTVDMEDVIRDFNDKKRELRKFQAMSSNTKSIKAAKEIAKQYKIKFQDILKTVKPDNNISGEKTWDKDGNIK